MYKNILIIGDGGREKSIKNKLNKDNDKLNIYLLNSNFISKELDIIQYIHTNSIDIVIVGPEAPLKYGIIDILEENNVKCIGPNKLSARIETDKIYCRNYIQSGLNNGIDYIKKYNPKYRVVKPGEDVSEYLKELDYKCVIKLNGLHGGKGVIISPDNFNIDSLSEDINKYCNSIMEPYLIEEKLVGDEFSLMSFCDGKTAIHMPIVQDFKRLLDGDMGPNTGSMGSISEANHKLYFLSDKDVAECKNVNETIAGLGYKGILYGSFMKTTSGEIKIIEFNARFGDPECINVLSILETPLLDIFDAMIRRELYKIKDNVVWRNEATLCRYIVSKDYPLRKSNYRFNFPSLFLNNPEVIIAGAVIDDSNSKLGSPRNSYLGSSRALAVHTKGANLSNCYDNNEYYMNIINSVQDKICYHYRNDIPSIYLNKRALVYIN